MRSINQNSVCVDTGNHVIDMFCQIFSNEIEITGTEFHLSVVQTQYHGRIQRKNANAESGPIHRSAKVGNLMEESKIIRLRISGGGSSTVDFVQQSEVGFSLSLGGKCGINASTAPQQCFARQIGIS
jgi:hypothetical protein